MHERFIYSFADPRTPEVIRYVGRTNTADLRFRMHLAGAQFQTTVKDLWLMHLRSANIDPVMSIVESKSFDSMADANIWQKVQEDFWIKQYVGQELDLVNSSIWWKRADRNIVPTAIRQAWQRAYAALFQLDWDWTGERELLEHLRVQYGMLSISTPMKLGTQVRSFRTLNDGIMAHHAKRWQIVNIILSLESAFSGLKICDSKLLNMEELTDDSLVF